MNLPTNRKLVSILIAAYKAEKWILASVQTVNMRKNNRYSRNFSGDSSVNSSLMHMAVDNCELFNWGYAAIRIDGVKEINNNNNVTSGWVHHNHIHHNNKNGLGYGTVINKKSARSLILLATDPQRPMATSEGIYEVGGPDENSPVLITSNFSLSYFIVSGEIETSRVPSYLLVKDTEGLSVMTAWAAGKFVPDEIALFVQKSGIAEKVSHRKLVIPGYAAQISGELEDELSGWKIIIGPREASQIPAFLKDWKAA